MRKITAIILLVIVLIIIGYFLVYFDKKKVTEQKIVKQTEVKDGTKFSDDFSKNITSAGGEMNESRIPNWWLNSGGYFYTRKGVGKTVQGKLPKDDKQRLKYRDYNASETDDGFHPQNIFRLVLTSKWKNFRQECYYKINQYILSEDESRNESNGILLFNRYQDENNLYYAGLRVDGSIVVKKKIDGKYFPVAQKVFYSGKYDRERTPNLLPIKKWIGIKSEVLDNPDGTVTIKVFVDKNRSGEWILALTAIDDGKIFGGAAIKNEGYAGIRTDFMDAEFDDYKIEEIIK